MRFHWACITLCACQSWGCENPRPVLTHVEPSEAYSDADVQLTLTGDNFLPTTTLDPASGSRVAVFDGFHVRLGKGNAWVELPDVVWQSTGQLAVSLSSTQASVTGFPAGYLDLEITDPRGQRATMTDAFDELGPDHTPPTIIFTSPPSDTPVGPGTILRGSFHASDAPPGALGEIGWTYIENDNPHPRKSCPVAPPAADVDCNFQVKVSLNSKEGERIQIVADATDAPAGRNRITETLSFTVLAPATVESISPTSGGTGGGTDVVITGSGFIAGSQAILDGVPLFPNGGIVINETTLSGHVPEHAAGSPSIVVRTPLGDASGELTFTYKLPPLLEDISPTMGAAGKGVALTGQYFTQSTQIYFGSTLATAIPLNQRYVQSDTMIIGLLPIGTGQTTVWAFDEDLGFTRIPNGFTWSTP
jgi:hypothetical protein